MNHFNPFESDDDFTAEEEAEDAQIEAALKEIWRRRLEAGWTQERDGKLMHPTDYQIWIMVDPFSKGLILSEKMSRQLQADRNEVTSA